MFEFDAAVDADHIGLDRMIPVVMEKELQDGSNWPSGQVRVRFGPTNRLFIDWSEDKDSGLSDDEDERIFDEFIDRLIQRMSQVSPPAP